MKNAGKYRIEPYLKSQGIHKLDAVFVTHGDEDHIGAIEEMLKRRKMGVRIVRLIFPPQSVWDEKLFRLAETGQGCGAKICIIEKEKQLLEKSGKEIFGSFVLDRTPVRKWSLAMKHPWYWRWNIRRDVFSLREMWKAPEKKR